MGNVGGICLFAVAIFVYKSHGNKTKVMNDLTCRTHFYDLSTISLTHSGVHFPDHNLVHGRRVLDEANEMVHKLHSMLYTKSIGNENIIFVCNGNAIQIFGIFISNPMVPPSFDDLSELLSDIRVKNRLDLIQIKRHKCAGSDITRIRASRSHGRRSCGRRPPWCGTR